MKLLVTGGAGFIGSNFIHYWLASHPKDYLINLDKLTYAGTLESLKDVAKNSNYEFVKGDIGDADLVQKVSQEVDTVVNFAAESHVDRSILDPDPFIQTNVVGTQILLDAALKNKVSRFHHISTDEVFGALPLSSKERFSETTPYNPTSPYAASKASSDHLVRVYGKTFGLPITITNCSNNYGPYQHPEKLISLAITNLIEGKKVPVYGDGLYTRDWLYVDDHCRAIELVLEKGKIGETYCIGQNHDVPNIDIIKRILTIMQTGDDMIEYVKDRPAHDRKYAIDSAKIKSELSWSEKYDLDKGLQETVKWYQENQDWWKKLKNKEFDEYYEKQYEKR